MHWMNEFFFCFVLTVWDVEFGIIENLSVCVCEQCIISIIICVCVCFENLEWEFPVFVVVTNHFMFQRTKKKFESSSINYYKIEMIFDWSNQSVAEKKMKKKFSIYIYIDDMYLY